MKFSFQYHEIIFEDCIEKSLFRLGHPINSFFVSDSLKAELERANITGIEFQTIGDKIVNKNFIAGYYKIERDKP